MIYVRLGLPSTILPVQSYCFSVLNFLLRCRAASYLQSNTEAGMGWRRPVLSLTSPQQRSTVHKSRALVGSVSVHGMWECWGPCTLGHEKVLSHPLQGTSTDPSCFLLPPLQVRQDLISWRGGIGLMKERHILVVLSFLHAICPKGYFCCYQEKIIQYSHSFLAANQWHMWGTQSLPARVGLVWVNKNYPSLFTACQQNKGRHKAFCSCPGWREKKKQHPNKQKKKLHLKDRSLGFWSRSCAWLPLMWHANSGEVVKGHLLANCLFGYWEQQVEKQKRWGYVGSQLTIRNQIVLFKRKLITRHIKALILFAVSSPKENALLETFQEQLLQPACKTKTMWWK